MLRGIGRVAVPVMCKLALLLTITQAPRDFSNYEETQGNRIAEEYLVAATAPVDRQCNAALSRRCSSHLLGRLPVATEQRMAACVHSQGHVLANGLRAPLRC